MTTLPLLGKFRLPKPTKKYRGRRRRHTYKVSRSYKGGSDIEVSPLKIVCDIKEDGSTRSNVTFEYSMLNYDKSIFPVSTKKYSKYPFFSSNIKYPDSLKSKLYGEIVDFFFNRITFKNTLENEYLKNRNTYVLDETSNPGQIKENELHNIMFMLTYLFRIIPSSYINPKNSYENFILGKTPFQLQLGSKNSQMGITIGNGKKIITDLIWLNDVYNHPKYFDFINSFVETKEKKKGLYKNILNGMKLKVNLLYKEVDNFINNPKYMDAMQKIYASPPATSSLTNPFVDATKHIWDKRLNALSSSGTVSDKEELSSDLSDLYLEYVDYNKKDSNKRVYYSMDKSLLDQLTKIYNAYIVYNAAYRCLDFVLGKIIIFNLKKKNNDGSDIEKKELDIINEMELNYKEYISLSKEIENSINSIYEPERRTSNIILYDTLKSFKETDVDAQQKNYNLITYLYNRYILGKLVAVPLDFNEDMLYTGINTTVGISGTGATETAQETKEIYLAMDLINEDTYKKTPSCVYNDSKLANKLNYLLDGVMHSVEKYRGEKYDLETDVPKTSAQSSNVPVANVIPPSANV